MFNSSLIFSENEKITSYHKPNMAVKSTTPKTEYSMKAIYISEYISMFYSLKAK